MRILIVEDDSATRDILMRALSRAGYDAVAASGGMRALELVDSVRPDLAILDVGLPDLDGFQVCRRIRLDSQVPIIMLTARNREEDVMQAFRFGADDYLTKPFSARVLVARVATVLRRTAETGRRQHEDQLRIGDLELDVQCHEVRKHGQQIRLSPLEFRIFHILAANKGRVVPYTRLTEFAWGHQGGSPSQLKIRIASIRKKVGLPLGGEPTIVGIRGTGYSLRDS